MMGLLAPKKTLAAIALVFFVLSAVLPVPVAQASWRDILLGGAIEYIFLREVLLYQHYNQNKQIFASYKKEYGVSDDERANRMLDSIMNRLQDSVGAKEEIKPKYSWFVNKQKGFNAFCGLGHNISVNAGLFKYLNYNEDEVAFVLAHEMVHGQRMHALASLPKIVAFSMVAQLYNERNPNNFSYIMSFIITKQLIAGYATLPQENEADQRSFEYAVDAGYNPGAGAAVWARVLAKEGDRRGNVFEKVINPNDHPTNSQRREYFSRRLSEYANGKVKVEGKTIYVAGQPWVAPAPADEMAAEERACFIAGNLARVFHGSVQGEKALVSQAGDVVLGGTRIMAPVDGDGPAGELADRLNEILGFE